LRIYTPCQQPPDTAQILFRVQSYPGSCHRGLKHIVFVLLMQRSPVLTSESMIAAVTRYAAKLMPTVVKQTYLNIYQYVIGCTAICGRRYPVAIRHKVPIFCVTFSSSGGNPAAHPPIIPTGSPAYIRSKRRGTTPTRSSPSSN